MIKSITLKQDSEGYISPVNHKHMFYLCAGDKKVHVDEFEKHVKPTLKKNGIEGIQIERGF